MTMPTETISMRSLYLKVFLAIWLVMVLVVGSNMLLTWLLAQQFQNSQQHDSQMEDYAQQALQQYQQGGADALFHWSQQLQQRQGLRVLLLDQRFRNLSNQPLPPKLVPRLQRALKDRYRFDSDRRHEAEPSNFAAAERRFDRENRRGGDVDDEGRHDHRYERVLRPSFWPIEDNNQQYLFVVINPSQLIDHLYSGAPLFWRLGLSLSLVGLLSVLMARYLIRPIRQLQRASRQLADGQLDTRVGRSVSQRRDELGQLGQDFDRMAEQIENLLHGQQQLLRDVSHELRTPLARQRIALELARKQPGSDKALDRIERQAELLDELINEILMLARLDTQAEPPAKTETDLNQLLQLLCDDFNVEQSRVTFSANQPVLLAINPKLFNRALSNVLGNALKYSQQPVTLQLCVEARQVRILIADQGPGIEETMLEKIFEPFVRTDQARSRQQGGWGLGLAIAARAIEQHQGTILARNLKPHGLEVEVKLPRNLA
ncbi:MAG: ATP-binding protein [Motiliproteus sp.]